METEAKEKRHFPRLNLKIPLRYQPRGTPKFNNSISNDISIGGLSFVDDGFIAPNTLLGLEINLLSKILNPVGRIIWSSPLPHSNKYHSGIEFVELDPAQQGYLKDYINTHLTK